MFPTVPRLTQWNVSCGSAPDFCDIFGSSRGPGHAAPADEELFMSILDPLSARVAFLWAGLGTENYAPHQGPRGRIKDLSLQKPNELVQKLQ